MTIHPSVHLLIDSFADVEVSGMVEGRKVDPADEALRTWSRLTPSAVAKYVDWGSMIYSCWSMYRRRRISVALFDFKDRWICVGSLCRPSPHYQLPNDYDYVLDAYE
jgi:hypothetical protein